MNYLKRIERILNLIDSVWDYGESNLDYPKHKQDLKDYGSDWRYSENGFNRAKKDLSKLLLDFSEEIQQLIVKEILIAQKEGQPTSRLTSLSLKVKKLLGRKHE